MRKTMKTMILTGLLATFSLAAVAQTTAFQGEELLPPNANPGECYARVFVAPTYRIVSEEMLKKEASERMAITPARYEWAQESVMVQGPTQRLETVPATYEWVEEQILVKPESTTIVEVPAVYKNVNEQVLERAAHTIWKRGRGPVEKVDNGTGEILCLIEVPATYRTVTKRVLASAATTRENVVPSKYDTVRRKVMKTEPTVRTIDIPPVYENVKVRKLVAQAETRAIPIPAEYQTVTRNEKITEGRMEWRRILCETNLNTDTILAVQSALKSAGFQPGDIDGKLGRETYDAIKSYQQRKGLAVGNLTYETLESLGVVLTNQI